MRIFWSFLIVLVSVVMLILPVTEAVYGFQTDVKEETFNVATGVGVTTASVVLHKLVYDGDTSTIILSSNVSEAPAFSSWTSGTRTLAVSALTENTTRQLTVTYDVDALSINPAIETLISKTPMIWYLMFITLPIAGVAAIWMGKG